MFFSKSLSKTLILGASLLVTSLLILFAYPVGYFILHDSRSALEKPLQEPSSVQGIGIYILNLDRSEDRYRYVRSSADNVGFPIQRISAVDGAKLSRQEMKHLVDPHSFQLELINAQRGMVGCYLSHLKTWEAFLNSSFKFALVLEDDVSFDGHKLRQVIQELTRIPHCWDITSFQVPPRMPHWTLKRLQNGQRLAIYWNSYGKGLFYASAYLINRRAARKLLAKALPIKLPLDEYFARAWEFPLTFTGIEKFSLVHQTFGDSEIGNSNASEPRSLPFSWKNWVRHKLFRIQSHTMRIGHSLGIYFSP